jgi:hypothetical protein
MNKRALCTIAAIIIILLLLRYIESNNETYIQAQTYDNGKQPFALSRQAIDLFINKSYELCIPRVKAECGETSPSLACVQKAMYECQIANRDAITEACGKGLPKNICQNACEHGENKMSCQTCLGRAKASGICQLPGIGPTPSGQMPY